MSTGGAVQASPDVAAEDTVNMYPSVDATVNTEGVEAVLAEIIEPLPVKIALSIKLDVSGDTKFHAEPL